MVIPSNQIMLSDLIYVFCANVKWANFALSQWQYPLLSCTVLTYTLAYMDIWSINCPRCYSCIAVFLSLVLKPNFSVSFWLFHWLVVGAQPKLSHGKGFTLYEGRKPTPLHCCHGSGPEFFAESHPALRYKAMPFPAGCHLKDLSANVTLYS